MHEQRTANAAIASPPHDPTNARSEAPLLELSPIPVWPPEKAVFVPSLGFGITHVRLLDTASIRPSRVDARTVNYSDSCVRQSHYGPSLRPVQLPQPHQVAELSIPVLVTGPRRVLATGPQREVPVAQQPGDGRKGRLEPSISEGPLESVKRAVRPLHAGDGIPGGRVRQQLLEGRQDSGRRVSARLGPAPQAPHPARRERVGLVQLAPASGDRIAVQARDPRQPSDSPVAVQAGEEAGDEPPAALVGASDDPVDRLVLTSDLPIRFASALGAGAAMNRPDIFLMGLTHCPLPP